MFPLNKEPEQNLFKEAVYLSSPSLNSELDKLSKNTLSEKDEKRAKIAQHKYKLRATSRCTPFGLFAAVGYGTFDSTSQILLNKDTENRSYRKTRLDMNVLCQISQKLALEEFVKPFLYYRPNTSIYKLGDHFRYVDYNYKFNKRLHNLSKVDYSEYLEGIINLSKNGVSMKDLVEYLVSDEISFEEALYFVNELINENILTSELDPTVTGDDYFEEIINILNRILNQNFDNRLKLILLKLNKVRNLLHQIDRKHSNGVDVYKEILATLKEIDEGIAEKNLVQTDFFEVPEQAHLSSNIQETLHKGLAFLNRITPTHQNQNLTDFKKSFVEKYGDAEIPLLQVLDPETGIGYANKGAVGENVLIDDLIIPYSSSEYQLNLNNLEECLSKLLTRSLIEGKKGITISEKDFEGVDYTSDKLPFSISFMFNITDSSKNEIQIKTAGGTSAINLLGRFTQGNEKIFEIAQKIANHEQNQLNHSILAGMHYGIGFLNNEIADNFLIFE